MHQEKVTPFDAKKIVYPSLINYNLNIKYFLKTIQLKYDICLINTIIFKTSNLATYLINPKKTYCCLLYSNKHKAILNFQFPIMIGSKLDYLVRFENIKLITYEVYKSKQSIEFEEYYDIQNLIQTCYIFNGFLKQVPYNLYNNNLCYHLDPKKKSVIKYIYNKSGIGSKLILSNNDKHLYVGDTKGKQIKLKSYCEKNKQYLNILLDEDSNILSIKDNSIDSVIHVMQNIKKDFDIDNLGNKLIFSSVELFIKAFFKDYLIPLTTWLITPNETNNKKREAIEKLINNNINTGTGLLHLLSKTTLFYKEVMNTIKESRIKQNGTNNYNSGEKFIGQNKRIFSDKNSTIYRDPPENAPQLIPFYSNIILKNLPERVKNNLAFAYHSSYNGFICSEYVSENKNIGRTLCFVRNIFVSVVSEKKISNFLKQINSIVQSTTKNKFLLIVNYIPKFITKLSFKKIENVILNYKLKLKFLEAFTDYKQKTHFIRFMNSIPYKKFKSKYGILYLSPLDLNFWLKKEYKISFSKKFNEVLENKLGLSFYTSWFTLFTNYYKHNPIQRTSLFIKSLKNAILAYNREFSNFFKTQQGVYFDLDIKKFYPIFKPKNKFSEHFQIYALKPLVLIDWFCGLNEEDSLVVNKSFFNFNITKCHTIRILIHHHTQALLKFRQTKGFIGTKPIRVGCLYDTLGFDLFVITYNFNSIVTVEEVKIDKNLNRKIYHIDYNKKGNWKVINYDFILNKSSSFLLITLESLNLLSDGDKCIDINGQKSVISIIDEKKLPFCRNKSSKFYPDAILHPISVIKRQTAGTLKQIELETKDSNVEVYNFDGNKKKGFGTCGYITYFLLNYLSEDHCYIASNVIRDAVTGHAAKGTQNSGGIKCGYMEINNCFIPNNIAFCANEILFKNCDSVFYEKILTTKSMIMAKEDALCLNVDLNINTKSAIDIDEN